MSADDTWANDAPKRSGWTCPMLLAVLVFAFGLLARITARTARRAGGGGRG